MILRFGSSRNSFVLEYDAICGGDVAGNEIVFALKGLNYRRNMNCVWTINRTYSYILKFDSFELEEDKSKCRYDYLRVGNGLRMCGKEIPKKIFVDATHGPLQLFFTSNNYSNFNGFSLTIIRENYIPGKIL